MNNLVFHNNFHRSNHHTIAINGYPESSKDPIASLEYPFIGTFYNDLYTIDGDFIAKTNSYEWWSTYTLTNSNSANWEKYLTTYTTVCSNSAFWDEYSFKSYSGLNSLSGNWQSTFDTLCANIEYWNAVYDPNTMYTNKVQESTRQKTFKNYLLSPEDSMNIFLDLSAGQVSTYYAEDNCKFSGFVGAKRGGIYHLILVLDTTSNPNFTVYFDFEKFRFSNDQNIYSINSADSLQTFISSQDIIRFGNNDPIVRNFIGSRYLRRFQFFYDGERLHGKSTLYDYPMDEKQLVTIVNSYRITSIGGENIFAI